MKILVTFRGMEHSNTLEDFVKAKLHKAERFLENEPSPVVIDVILEAALPHPHHRVEFRLHSPHYKIIANREGTEIYAEVEAVADIFTQEIARAKQKRVDELKHRSKLSGIDID